MTIGLQFVISGILVLIACGMVLCRIDKMLKGVTKARVFVQHALLAGSLFGAFLLMYTSFFGMALGVAAIGIISYLWLSMDRWRYGPPRGTMNDISPDQMAKVIGRGKS